ncbi:hypothetical protein ABE137_03755 [Brevibacillus laterosporus]|uniref:hypothetical protein n=1 Tax=Brevibacillus laterosporus TaxID=1465 RepID=UPI003D1BA29C
MTTLAHRLNGRRLCITKHAIEEATKDFGIEPRKAASWVAETAKKAEYISHVIGIDKKHGHLYGYNRACFIVRESAANTLTVVTVHPAKPRAVIRNKVETLLSRELRKMETQERTLHRKITLIKAELEIEKAELNLRLLRARSESKKLAYKARIKAINEYFTQLDGDLLAVKHDKRGVAKSIAAYM